jgi:hypothetical protein
MGIWDAGDDLEMPEPRHWLPGNQFCRKFLSGILAPGSTGNGQRYSNASAAADRAAWSVVQRHCPGKTEQQCRDIVSTWVKGGLLCVADYDDPKTRKPRKGLCVDNSKRPQ